MRLYEIVMIKKMDISVLSLKTQPSTPNSSMNDSCHIIESDSLGDIMHTTVNKLLQCN